MNKRLAPILLLVVVVAAALMGEASEAVGDPVSRAREVLREQRPELGLRADLADLTPVGVRSGLGGDYVRFQQTLGGIPVAGAEVVVVLPSDGSKEPVQSRYRPGFAPRAPEAQVPEQSAITRAFQELDATPAELRGQVTAERVYAPVEGEYRLVWQVLLPLLEPFGTWLVGIGAGGEVLYSADMLRFDEGQVFDPNPPYHSEGSIPPPMDCDSSANESVLSSQYLSRELQGILDGQNQLRGEYVDLTAPGIVGGYKPAGLADEPSRVYNYPCTDDRFEEVMAYYHIDSTQRKIQSLGFTGAAAILAEPVPVHAHYFEGCNAFYDPRSGGLHFGDGGGACLFNADAAEDADVIVHEYGHAVQDDQVPGWGIGAPLAAEQAWAMGEGFADFLTAAMFGDSCLAEWFSFGNECLRQMQNGNQYPADFEACRPAPGEPAQEHCAGRIWGGALWDLAQALGGDQSAFDRALALVLEGHFMLSPIATFDEAATAIRTADGLLFGGANGAAIDSVFAARGISTAAAIEDFAYAYLRIDHPRRGHLDVDLLVGSQTSPICSLALFGPVPGDNGADLVGYAVLEDSACEPYLPPTSGEPWYLRVRDVTNGFTGTLLRFDIALDGPGRCVATDVPISIPDNGPFIYSEIDCSTMITGEMADDDGDGFTAAEELHVGTDPTVPCGSDGWPADIISEGLSADKIDIHDLASFIVPLRYLGTNLGTNPGDRRWDLSPGPGPLSVDINIIDLATLVSFAPPMFDGQRAFNGPICSSPP